MSNIQPQRPPTARIDMEPVERQDAMHVEAACRVFHCPNVICCGNTRRPRSESEYPYIRGFRHSFRRTLDNQLSGGRAPTDRRPEAMKLS